MDELTHHVPAGRASTSEAEDVYAGIGARATPRSMLEVLTAAAYELALLGWTLRHGFADGADQACHAGALQGGGRIDAFLPLGQLRTRTAYRARGTCPARPAGRADPNVRATRARGLRDRCTLSSRLATSAVGVRALHARNSHQILGEDLQKAVRFVLCWTADGSLDGAASTSGGTGQALRIAAHHEIPVLNISRPEHLARVTRRPR